MVDNVTREWLLPSNEIFPCQSPICEFSISIRLSDYRLQMMMLMIMIQQVIKELHKTATPGTAHTHTAGSTDVKYTTFNMGNSVTCAIYCNNRIAATVYSVATWFVCGV